MEFKRECEMEINEVSNIGDGMVDATLVEAEKDALETDVTLLLSMPRTSVDLDKIYYVTIATEGAEAAIAR